MTTIAVDTRTFRLRVPVLWLGQVRGSVVVRISEQVELHIERRQAAAEGPESRARSARARALALERADAHRTAALAHRLPSF